jgi:ABC-type transporter Mla MlaB component
MLDTKKEIALLRITRSDEDGTIWLRLEGKLLGPWVDEFRATVAREVNLTDRIKLDLAEVTFVDAEGLRLLRELAVNGHDIPKRSNFVAELLRTETSP